MEDFTFSEDMIRAALTANGWIRNRKNRWYHMSQSSTTSVDRDTAFLMLLRDKNLA